MISKERLAWRKYIKEPNPDPLVFKDFNFPKFQIPHEELALEDMPEPTEVDLKKIKYFALTFNAYNDKELKDNQNLLDEYFKEKKHTNSLRHLRGILFLLQRAQHFNMTDCTKEYIQIVKDIKKNIK